MLKHKRNAMIKISPLDMPDNDYFKYIDERMKELDLKEDSDEKSQTSKNNKKSKKGSNKFTPSDLEIESINFMNLNKTTEIIEKTKIVKERAIQVDEIKPETMDK